MTNPLASAYSTLSCPLRHVPVDVPPDRGTGVKAPLLQFPHPARVRHCDTRSGASVRMQRPRVGAGGEAGGERADGGVAEAVDAAAYGGLGERGGERERARVVVKCI